MVRKEILIGSCVLLAGILCGSVVGRKWVRNEHTEPLTPKVDTLVIHDTIRVTEAVSITKRVIDSIPFPVTDTILLRDTLFVFLEREQVRWEDSLSVVYASGIDPIVDSVIHYTQGQVIIKEIPVIQVKKTRWGIGIQAGATADKNGLQPYLGVGLSYNIMSW